MPNLLETTFNVHGIGESIQDEGLTEGLNIKTGALVGRLKAGKSLFKTGLAEFRSKRNKARAFHNDKTWEGFGSARIIIPSELDFYRSRMAALIAEIDTEAQSFIAHYAHWKEVDKEELKGAYCEDDYPAIEKLPDGFGVDFLIRPMADPNEFLKEYIGAEMRQQLKTDYEARIKNVEASIRRQILNRFLSMIADTAESLANDGPIIDSENKKGPVAKLREYMERIPALNADNDPQIANLYEQCKTRLDLSTELLRNSEFHKKKSAMAAADIVSRFGQVGARKLAA
jgi:hypothetical protein